MPPIFQERSFEFSEGEIVPDHIEGYADPGEQELDKYGLVGTDTFAHEKYPLAINIDDFPTASLLADARRRKLNRTQPNAGSIQDTVSILHPGDSKRIRL